MPYENSFLQKPPLIIYTYALGQLISENNFWPPRLLAFLSLVLTAFLIYLIAKQEFGERAGWIGAFLFCCSSFFSYQYFSGGKYRDFYAFYL